LVTVSLGRTTPEAPRALMTPSRKTPTPEVGLALMAPDA
jgi:hypothetical protein